MPPRSRLVPHILIGLALALLLGGASEDANWQRLRSMPREHRQILAEKIREFDGLARDEQARIRDLDRRIAALPPADQVSYRSILRRYHIWLQSLPEDQRRQLDGVPASGKMAAVAQLRGLPRRNEEKGPSPLPFQLADLRGRSPFEVAHILEIWFKLSPKERTEVEGLGSRERLVRLTQIARRDKIPAPAGLTEDQISDTLRDLEKNAPTKGFLRAHLLKKDVPEKPFLDRRRMANNYYFLINPPKPVSPRNLLRFDAAMPSWFRTTFDHLPPDEARRRLTVLYRLLYPAPAEIPPAGPFGNRPPEPANGEKPRPGPGPGPGGRRPSGPGSASPPL